MVWSVIPAIFKAKWRTNETLFTLMMNYVAMQLVALSIFAWVPAAPCVGYAGARQFPERRRVSYIINIIIVAVMTC